MDTIKNQLAEERAELQLGRSNSETGSRTVAGVKWDKVPSVTGGGKPYFWNTAGRYEDRRTVVWDRFCKCWVVKGPQTLEHKYGKAYMTFDSDKEARAYVEAGKAI